MNVVFVTGDPELDKKFIAGAKEEGLGQPRWTQNSWRYACQHIQCNANRRRKKL